MPSFWSRLGVESPMFDPDCRLVTSPVLSPLVLALARLAFAIYSLGTLVYVYMHELTVNHEAAGFFSYFTRLSLIGICAYMWAAGTHTLVYAINLRRVTVARKAERSVEKRSTEDADYPLQSWPRFLQFLHCLLYSTIVTFPILVTTVYFALLVSPKTFSTPFSTWSNISQHALNAFYALFEIFLTHASTSSGPTRKQFSSPMPWLHLPFCILLLGGYLGVAYITHETQGFYSYAFLDPSKGPILAAYIVGIAVAECLLFSAVKGVCTLREKISAASKPAAPEELDWNKLARPNTNESKVTVMV